eukprot:1194026-Prorocentrum_minimum.AAC.5
MPSNGGIAVPCFLGKVASRTQDGMEQPARTGERPKCDQCPGYNRAVCCGGHLHGSQLTCKVEHAQGALLADLEGPCQNDCSCRAHSCILEVQLGNVFSLHSIDWQCTFAPSKDEGVQ